ncbi:hypothetical protein DUNSADRAFT_16942 [Dunaliella salina]|uniref:Uncharacterized protein n=1 Tax=Dunaliella salina TaxID=3046 RepID=A0ABQ7H0N8_DUNSA|nr:hypothetical protein DUNSADRAFT_16942 [Dunaliella salina]|eukprot:KAF5840394.1 hypothetical protein DUNSADRAFT_16942 [Dunaliella salina]
MLSDLAYSLPSCLGMYCWIEHALTEHYACAFVHRCGVGMLEMTLASPRAMASPCLMSCSPLKRRFCWQDTDW